MDAFPRFRDVSHPDDPGQIPAVTAFLQWLSRRDDLFAVMNAAHGFPQQTTLIPCRAFAWISDMTAPGSSQTKATPSHDGAFTKAAIRQRGFDFSFLLYFYVI
jgi:hypothetical protein